VVCLIAVSLELSAQGEVDDKKRVFRNHESTVAIELTSNGYGFDFRRGTRIDGFKKRLFTFGFNYIKHPKEIRYATRGKKYVFGKLNSLYTLSATYGFQNELFSKLDKGGIAIRLIYGAGFTAGILKPYYYLRDSTSNGDEFIVTERFKASAHTDYLGEAHFLYGIEKTTLVPGITADLGMNFEFGNEERSIRALECGVELCQFLKKIEHMATNSHNSFYMLLYLRFRIGKITGKY